MEYVAFLALYSQAVKDNPEGVKAVMVPFFFVIMLAGSVSWFLLIAEHAEPFMRRHRFLTFQRYEFVNACIFYANKMIDAIAPLLLLAIIVTFIGPFNMRGDENANPICTALDYSDYLRANLSPSTPSWTCSPAEWKWDFTTRSQ